MLKPTDWRSEEGGVGQRFRRMCALIGLDRSRGLGASERNRRTKSAQEVLTRMVRWKASEGSRTPRGSARGQTTGSEGE